MSLSNDRSELQPGYDVVVIGSGYGGAICAARLAQAGRSVCLLERGNEWQTGEFPDTVEGCVTNVRSKHNPLGLFDYKVGEDQDVLVGNGLGGTSLINANVVIEPDHELFQRPRWPEGIKRAAREGELAELGKLFIRQIDATDEGPAGGWPRKVSAMEKSAAHTGARFEKLRLAVNMRHYDDEPNAVGVHQKLCTLCGDCVTGCNVGAKNTLTVNYLPLAKKHNAQIFTGLQARYLSAAEGGGFHVHFDDLVQTTTGSVFGSVVVVSAGALGSTGLLLASGARGLPLSERVGHHFSGNADQLGFGYNNDIRTDTLGFGNHDDKRAKIQVGPTIMSMLDCRESDTFSERYIVEEGAIPRAFVDVFRGVGSTLEHFGGIDTDKGVRDKLGELSRAALDWVKYDVDGAANHSMVYLGMGHDGSDGRVVLSDDEEPKVLWGALPDREVFQSIGRTMYGAVEALGGTYVKNPRWSKELGRNLITVHPLGGCPMGDDIESGVVNEYGEVFNPVGDSPMHSGLFVADGSVLPESVGVNPLYTIAVVAERTARHIASRDDLPRNQPAPPAPPRRPMPVGLEFGEEMKGYFTTAIPRASTVEEYQRAFERGRAEDNPLSFRLTMLVDNLDRFIDNARHEARTEGVVDSNAYGRMRRVDRGRFNLFVNSDQPNTRNMLYRLRFETENGRRLMLDGYKVVRDDPGLDLWADNTTLYVTVRDGWDLEAVGIATGMLHINALGFLSLLRSLKVTNAPEGQDLAHVARFGRFFLGTLWDTYVMPKLQG